MLRQLEISFKDISNICNAINRYNELWYDITSLVRYNSKYYEKLKSFHDKHQPSLNKWKDVDLHVIKQTWGNTSCGWQGIGGAAISSYYTIIIENLNYNISFIFYTGKLAYICYINEKYDINKLPGLAQCEDELDILYKFEFN